MINHHIKLLPSRHWVYSLRVIIPIVLKPIYIMDDICCHTWTIEDDQGYFGHSFLSNHNTNWFDNENNW